MLILASNIHAFLVIICMMEMNYYFSKTVKSIKNMLIQILMG